MHRFDNQSGGINQCAVEIKYDIPVFLIHVAYCVVYFAIEILLVIISILSW